MKKKLLALLLLAGGVLGAKAQSIRPRVEVGGVMSVVEAKAGSLDLSSKAKLGYRVSAVAEIGFGSGVYIAPGITFKSQGGNYDLNNLGKMFGLTPSDADKAKTNRGHLNYNYLSVPVNLGFRAELSPRLGFSVEIGPYFAYALSGKAVIGSSDVNLFSMPDFAKKSLEFKRFDAGLNASVAVDYSGVIFRLGTEYGLTENVKVQPLLENLLGPGSSASMKNFNAYTSVGFRF
ncbi:MAG: porin family protein [Porphyromonas sp.]|nr:porin family protein [Porphyromonas sp.]